MTKQARLVLDDCKGALQDFKNGIQGSQWRRQFVLCVVLLRAVGHVLNKIDAKTHPKLKKIIDKEFDKLKNTKPKPEIFWKFIEEERNLILKAYQINAGQSVTIKVGENKAEYAYPYYGKSFQNIDQRILIQNAINWWDNYLKNIEQQYKT